MPALHPHGRFPVTRHRFAHRHSAGAAVNVVINSGLTKLPAYDPQWERTVLALHFTSRASVRQRAGRAGRTMPGLVFHLFPRAQGPNRTWRTGNLCVN